MREMKKFLFMSVISCKKIKLMNNNTKKTTFRFLFNFQRYIRSQFFLNFFVKNINTEARIVRQSIALSSSFSSFFVESLKYYYSKYLNKNLQHHN